MTPLLLPQRLMQIDLITCRHQCGRSVLKIWSEKQIWFPRSPNKTSARPSSEKILPDHEPRCVGIREAYHLGWTISWWETCLAESLVQSEHISDFPSPTDLCFSFFFSPLETPSTPADKPDWMITPLTPLDWILIKTLKSLCNVVVPRYFLNFVTEEKCFGL